MNKFREVAITSHLFRSSTTSKKRFTLLARGHLQTTGDLFKDQGLSTSHTTTGLGPEEEQVYTPIEGEAQTFTINQEPTVQPSFDHQMADQSQQPQPQPQPPDPMVVVINAAVQAAMNYQQANQHQFPTASGKNYKIVDQTPFDGKLKQLNPSFRNVK